MTFLEKHRKVLTGLALLVWFASGVLPVGWVLLRNAEGDSTVRFFMFLAAPCYLIGALAVFLLSIRRKWLAFLLVILVCGACEGLSVWSSRAGTGKAEVFCKQWIMSYLEKGSAYPEAFLEEGARIEWGHARLPRAVSCRSRKNDRGYRILSVYDASEVRGTMALFYREGKFHVQVLEEDH